MNVSDDEEDEDTDDSVMYTHWTYCMVAANRTQDPRSINLPESCEQFSCGVQARGLPEHVQHEGLVGVVIQLALRRRRRRRR